MFHPSTCLSLQSAAVDSRKDSRWTHIVEHNWFERNCAFEIAVVVVVVVVVVAVVVAVVVVVVAVVPVVVVAVVVVVVVVAVVNEMVHLSCAHFSTRAVLPYIQIQARTHTALRNRFGHDLFECPVDRY